MVTPATVSPCEAFQECADSCGEFANWPESADDAVAACLDLCAHPTLPEEITGPWGRACALRDDPEDFCTSGLESCETATQ